MTLTTPQAPASSAFHGLRVVFEMIKIEHTIFALPFALMGMMLAAHGWPEARVVAWILVAMVGARSAAMAFNRLVDRDIDARNPRTATRAIPAGQVTPGFVAAFVVVSLALFFLACWKLNPLCVRLFPFAVVVLLGYSYTKRFTALSHLVLGLALGGAPVGAWMAVRGDVTIVPLLLCAAVLLWVAGFDILYSLQDETFDKAAGLHSIPAALGKVGALWLSVALHIAMLGVLAFLPSAYPPGLGTAYWIGLAGCAAFLTYQHWIVRPNDLSRLNAAFFTANGLLAVWLFGCTAVDLVGLS
jgi:4-hydroxybenzoate polyprenyltransferase